MNIEQLKGYVKACGDMPTNKQWNEIRKYLEASSEVPYNYKDFWHYRDFSQTKEINPIFSYNATSVR